MENLSKNFSEQQKDAINSLRTQLEVTQKKSTAFFVSIVGLKDKFKGLDIVSVIGLKSLISEEMVTNYSAKLSEYYLKYKDVKLNSDNFHAELQFISYDFGDNGQFVIFPIEGNDDFIVTAQTSQPKKIQKDLLKIRIALYKIEL